MISLGTESSFRVSFKIDSLLIQGIISRNREQYKVQNICMVLFRYDINMNDLRQHLFYFFAINEKDIISYKDI